MKLKGKLILSCAALAAVATTAFSTTYAWYTSNDTVKAESLTAGTDSAESDALQISKNGEQFFTSVSLSDVNTDLMPVSRNASEDSESTFNLQGEDLAPGDGSSATKDTGIVQFTLWFRNVSKDSAVFLSAADIANNNAGGVSTKLITDLCDDFKADTESAYYVDLLRATNIEIAVFTGQVGDGDPMVDASVSDWTFVSNNVYDLESYQTADDSLTELDGWDALNYYNAVKGVAVERPADYYADDNLTVANPFSSEAVGSKLSDTATDTLVKTIWTVYLDGWDQACYDACKNQTLSIDLTFNTGA